MRGLLFFVLNIALVFALPALSAAQDDDARAHFLRGQTAYQQGDYETSLSEWNRAYELDARPLIQFNLAQAYERLGRLTEAAAALDSYLESAAPDDVNQGDARARRSALRERLARTGVIIRGGPDGATILVDGTEWGRTPRPDAITLEPGSHRVVVRHAGYRDYTAAIVIPAGQRIEIDVEMEEEASVTPVGPTPPPVSPAPAAEGGSVWPWVLMIGGGGFFAVGLGVGAGAMGVADSAPSSTSSEADTARGLASAADGLMVLGVLAAGTGAVWYLFFDDPEVEQPPAAAQLRVTPLLGPDGAGASATVRF